MSVLDDTIAFGDFRPKAVRLLASAASTSGTINGSLAFLMVE